MNTVDWIVFYEESTVINSLLNRPLEPMSPQTSRIAPVPLRTVLRILILDQWALMLGGSDAQRLELVVHYLLDRFLYSFACLLDPPAYESKRLDEILRAHSAGALSNSAQLVMPVTVDLDASVAVAVSVVVTVTVAVTWP
jgi:hypothetical protein